MLEKKQNRPPLLINQRYTIQKNLGGGLSGEVMLVEDNKGVQSALKFLKKVQLGVSREDALKNFKNEFSILKELNHPNISRILDFGYDERMRKYFFTCEFIQGAELHTACEGQSVEVIEKLIVQVLRALNYLHARGIYHFDVKPQNILCAIENGVPTTAKMIDFGLAGFASPRKKVGTPAYMAPEVIQGGVLDGRTDLYSTGVLIYKLLTGTNPFADKSLKQVLDNQLKVKPKPASQVNPKVPAYWDHILARLLEKDPNKRYSQASLVIRDLNFLSQKNFDIETKDTKLSYLPEKGTLIGREEQWKQFTQLFTEIFETETPSENKTLIITGKKGTGKSRLLSEMKYFAQLKSVSVKTKEQYSKEENNDNFILLIDTEEATENELNTLVQENSSKKCLIVWATNVEPKSTRGAEIIHLSNYTPAQLKLYLESVTGLSDAPQKLIQEIEKRTAGNPLFVTEFIKSLLNLGVLFDSSGKWDATTFEDIKIDFDQVHIPNSFEEFASEKYNDLSTSGKELIELFATHQSPILLDQIKKLYSKDDLSSALLELIEADLVQKTSREHQYDFKNISVGQVLYKNMDEQSRLHWHQELAKLYEGSKSHKETYLYHLGHSGLKDQNAKALLALGQLQIDEPNYGKALQTFESIRTNFSKPISKYGVEACFKIAKVQVLTRNYKESEQTLQDLKKSITNTEHDTPENQIQILEKLTDLAIKDSQIEAAEQLCLQALENLNESKNPTESLRFKNYQAYITLKKGNIEDAEKEFLANQKVWNENLSLKDKIKVPNNRLLDTLLLQQKNEEAIQLCEDNIRFLNQSKNKSLLSQNHYGLGYVYNRIIAKDNSNDQKLVDKCIYHYEMAEKCARDVNDYDMMLRSFNGLGNMMEHQKNREKALEFYNRALAISRKIEDLFTASLLSYNIGSIHNFMKNDLEAYSYFIYTINTLEQIQSTVKSDFLPYVQTNLYLSQVFLSGIYLRQYNDAIKAKECLSVAQDLLNTNDNLKAYDYWKEARLTLVHNALGELDLAKKHADLAKSLIKTEEEQQDFNDVLATLGGDKSENAKTPKKGYQVMTSTHKNDNLKKIIEINNLINSEYNTQELLKIVLNYAIQLSNAEAGFVMLMDAEGELQVQAQMNTNSDDEEKISLSIASMALEKGEIISSSDALSDERFDSSESIVLNELKSVLCLPIRSKNKSIGVFYLDNRYRVNAFDEVDVDLLNAFCDQVGIALENNKLVSHLKDTQAQLKTQLDETEEELEQVKDILKSESETYKSKYAYTNIISTSDKMNDIFKVLDKITETNLSVFIHGASGTGKELIAKALHYNNPSRSKNRFVAINCGAIPANLMESELFGYKAGSFTGATKDKKGLFEEANGGTLFLDEIGELDPQLQVKLLRALQEGEVQRIGAAEVVKVNVRVVCASHRDMKTLIDSGEFREDLYYRLCQMRLDLPNLSERKEDIPLLAKHFVKKYIEEHKIKGDLLIQPSLMKAMIDYSWPGNIRELENLISVACALSERNQLTLQSIPENHGIKHALGRSHGIGSNLADMNTGVSKQITLDGKGNFFDASKTWYDYEQILVTSAYIQNEKKKVPTADMLGVSHSTIYKKISDFQLDDESNALYAEDFEYDPTLTLKEYVVKVFGAALEHHNGHPYAAIKQLGVSQGYFYKILKQIKKDDEAQVGA